MGDVAYRAAYYGVVFDGDSLNYDPFGATPYPDLMMASRSGVWHRPARGGWAWSQLLNGNPTGQLPFAQRVAPYCKLAEYVVYVQVGGINGYALGQSGATVYGNEKDAAVAAKAAGADYVIGTTTLPATSVTGGNETKRTDGNTLVLANGDSAFDAVVDLAANTDLDDPADTTWYHDGIHPTTAGRTVMATLIGTALDAALTAQGITP